MSTPLTFTAKSTATAFPQCDSMTQKGQSPCVILHGTGGLSLLGHLLVCLVEKAETLFKYGELVVADV